MLALGGRVGQAAHVRRGSPPAAGGRSPAGPRSSRSPGPALKVRHVHQRAVRGGRPDALARHPHPGDLLDDLAQPRALDRGEVHPHRELAVRGAEASHRPRASRRRRGGHRDPARGGESDRRRGARTTLRRARRSARAAAPASSSSTELTATRSRPRSRPRPAPGAEHDRVLAVVPALQAVAQLDLQRPADREPIARPAPVALSAQRPGGRQPRLHVAATVRAVVVAVAVADVDAAAAVQRPADGQHAARDRAVRPVEPAIAHGSGR